MSYKWGIITQIAVYNRGDWLDKYGVDGCFEYEDIDDCLPLDACEGGYGVCCEPFYESDQRRKSCSFTGHRDLSVKETRKLLPKLRSTILYLISQGVTEFHAGGAEGFDTLAAGVVHEISRTHEGVRLVLELPYERSFSRDTDTSQKKRFYEYIKSVADEVNIHGKKPTGKLEAVECLYKRNRVLMNKSYYCVCYMREPVGGTAYTVNYAKTLDCLIINLAE